MYRKTYAEIDLTAIAGNLDAFRKLTGGGVKILLPVKANAYGHGLEEVSRYVEETGSAEMLGISSPDEGILLREAGVRLPLLNMGLILPGEEHAEPVLDYNITQTVADLKTAEVISRAAAARDTRVPVHLIVDTGMGRVGCSTEEALGIISGILSLKNLLLEGIYSHYPVADEPENDFTREQVKRFNNILHELERMKIHIPLRHISNSAGTINFTNDIYEMIRPGVMSYGCLPLYGMETGIQVVPAMTLKSVIVFTKRVQKGTGLSYGLTYTTDSDANIATIPIGYGDGYSRHLSNRGKVVIGGRIYPVVGRVTMDQILVNLGNDIYPPGEEVILFGKEKVTADDIAQLCGTISYEVTSQINSRVPRVFLR